MGKIFYVMGKSSVGKDTVYNRLAGDFPALKKVVLYTTRPMREGEKEGETYRFVTLDTLRQLEKAGTLIEMRTYHTVEGDWHYATVDDGSVNIKESDYLMIGTLESYEKIRDYYGPEAVRPLYLTVEDGERLRRAALRESRQTNPNYAEVCRRYLADERDFSPENLARLCISSSFENDDLESCVKEIEKEIAGEIEKG